MQILTTLAERWRLAMLCLLMFLATVPSMQAQAFIPVSGTKLLDHSGATITNGTLCAQPTLNLNGANTSVSVAGGGQTINSAVCAAVTGGSFNLTLANTYLSNPKNFCYAFTVTDNLSQAVELDRGYECVQPTSDPASTWCGSSNGSTACNFDKFPINLAPQVAVQTGPRGLTGPAGSNGPLAFAGYFIPEGDSLEDGHGLPGFQSPGYPNPPPAGAWPSVLATLPVFQTGVSVVNTNVDGIGLSTMDSMYTSAVHPYTAAVTGKPCIVSISIYGNDLALIAGEGLAAYESSYAQHLARIRADGCKVMFLAQWAQTGRQGADANRLAFNEYNRQNADYYLDATDRFNNPSNTTLFESDGLHANLEGSREIAVMAQQVLLSGGVSKGYGNVAYENPNNPFPVLMDGATLDAMTVRNTDPAGYSSLLYNDSAGNAQFSLGYANPSAAFFAGTAFLNVHSSNTPLSFCILGTCSATMNTDGHWSFVANNNLDAITAQSSNAAGYGSIAFLDSTKSRQLSMGYGNPSASFSPGAAYINSVGTLSFYATSANGDALFIQNNSNNGYSSVVFRDNTGVAQGTMGYANSGSNSGFVPGSVYINTKLAGTSLKLCAYSVCPLTVNTNNSVSLSAPLVSSSTFQAAGFAETLFTPASSTSPCSTGQFTNDANYHYVCTAPNVWKRVALSAF